MCVSSYIRIEKDEEHTKCLISVNWTMVGLSAGAITAAIKTCKIHRCFTKKITGGSKLPRQVIQPPLKALQAKSETFVPHPKGIC